MSDLNPDFDTTKVTLMYLANSVYQEEEDKKEPSNKKKEREENKFYRKRIHALSKEMLKGKYPNDTLKRAHKTLVNRNKLFKVQIVRLLKNIIKSSAIPEVECEEQLPLTLYRRSESMR